MLHANYYLVLYFLLFKKKLPNTDFDLSSFVLIPSRALYFWPK